MKATFLTAKAALVAAFAVACVEFAISGGQTGIEATGQPKFDLTAGEKMIESLVCGVAVFVVMRALQWSVLRSRNRAGIPRA